MADGAFQIKVDAGRVSRHLKLVELVIRMRAVDSDD